MCNARWLDKFKDCVVNIPVACDSDNCPLKVVVEHELPQEPRPFKFKSFWMKHDSYIGVVERVWGQEQNRDGMEILHGKLKKLKAKLRGLNTLHFSNISSRVVEKNIELEELNGRIFSECVEPGLLTMAANVEGDYQRLCKTEFPFYKEKSRVQWYKEGDASTTIFHNSMKLHHAQNRIAAILHSDGHLVNDHNELKQVVVDFYKNLFSAPANSASINSVAKDMVKRRIKEEDIHKLRQPDF
ncbi:hypothetical protein LIER_40645 [Lithospermum erythrorhizon]|uniref:Uncharacterized protein n=1 Tax=Lithospermum erythrorhizon TaxID=34254 RepID=A0AAV3QYV6_LITER